MTLDAMLDELIKREGGYVNDPDDPGGETKYGIAKRYHPDVDIKNLTLEGAKSIYLTKYFIAPKFHLLPPFIREQMFDIGVHMGVEEAAKMLQRIVGVAADGKIGPRTLAALAAAPNLREVNNNLVVARVQGYVARVVKNRKKIKYLKGWTNRAFQFLLS